MATNVPVTLDTLIVVKIQYKSSSRKFKIPLRDLGAQVFPEKLRALLEVPASQPIVFERYSDSVGAYVTLDSNKPQVYKTLFRAAKAKLKLRLRATIPSPENVPAPAPASEHPSSPISPVSLHRMSTDTLTPQHAAPVVAPVIAYTPAPIEKQSEVEATPNPVSPLLTKTADAEVPGEAPVPRAFTARHSFFSGFAAASSSNPSLAIRPKTGPIQTSWVVYCNNCNLPLDNEHYHCNICDQGDYDLCHSCVDSGIHCPGSNHWMVKRFVKDGSVVNSTTERVTTKAKPEAQTKPCAEKQTPCTCTEEKPLTEVIDLTREEPTRTCNCCIQVLRETEFVTCTSCEDYDLCLECHLHIKHGHHPGHVFKAAVAATSMPALADFLCKAGRNVRHSAVCDGCEKFIYGVRHKCLICPDWDFCSKCVESSKFIHPGHRFVPIYEPLAEPASGGNRHYGIYCDGPLCKDKENTSYIEGIRFKCAVCNDTDFCANCEAHPSNRHNQTHPLIKFKRPVRSVSVTTLNEDHTGSSITRVGDREPTRSFSSESVAAVQTIADVKPTAETQPKKIEIRELLSEPVQENMGSSPTEVKPSPIVKPESSLDAHFVRDTILDGTRIATGQQFVQTWTLQNPGPASWPAGCSVRHVGGDNMLNIDNTQPLSQSELAEASETNVLDCSVAPGEEISFRVVMKAPAREGTAISYWRLKTADGLPFGHRLWCDIQVVPSILPMTTPTSIEAAEASRFSANMTPYERFQQAKMERLRALRNAQSQAQSARLERAKVEGERTGRIQEEALERLRKIKLNLAEKDNQTRLLEKIEREKMLRIQKVRKAAVERLLETRRKEHEAYTALQQQEQSTAELISSEKAAEEAPKTVEKAAEEAPKTVEKAAEEAPKTVEKAVEPEPQSSGMIFPQLDKESPASSTHEAVDPQLQPPQLEEPSVPASTVEHSDEEFFEDAESVELRSLSSDDGFMTDEEYDILDASDEEMP